MTYLGFLGLFLAPALLLAAVLTALVSRRHPGPAQRGRLRMAAWITALLVVAALVWTPPWDSWIIRHGVWSYPPDGVLATWGRVPFEEYLFMAGQTVLIGLWSIVCLLEAAPPRVFIIGSRAGPRLPDGGGPPLYIRRLGGVLHGARTIRGPGRRTVFCALWLSAAALGSIAAADTRLTYLGALLVWFGPLLALQAGVGADLMADRRRLRALMVVPVWLYLCVIDRVAIAAGTWRLSPERTTGLRLLGLPVEEAIFFAVTCLLVVNALVIATHPRVADRLPCRRPRPRGLASVPARVDVAESTDGRAT
ncbi:lycopene cyclase domain-containing protein [Kitasatospora sp. NPDC048540]|uniref:lycopene cyclase domain-containing protein n=1 Tax=unclassified Kitasatospora TaxID=2633591 RepID=UPI00068C8F26|nr:lycopene cyclase domain-containing protein [Kitasatospora sp. MBT63]